MTMTEDLRKILNIGIVLTSEKSYSKLLETIIQEAMDITGCDAGTLYVMKDNKLHFMIMRNNTMNTYLGGDGEEINMPPVEMSDRNVCTYCAIHKTAVNIDDVYSGDDRFDWQGPKRYDSLTGYHTQSMLVIPLVNHEEEVLGVLQLINAIAYDGSVVPFDHSYEYIIYSLASQASISLSNMVLIQDLKDLMASFVTSMTTAIDSRTPYNANHTVNVARYCDEIADYIHRKHEEGKISIDFSENQRDQLVLAARLHDIGKMITPLSVMNKATRVGTYLPAMESRWRYIKTAMKVRVLEGKITQEEYENNLKIMDEAKETIITANTAGFLIDPIYEKVLGLEHIQFEVEDGVFEKFITDEEFVCLSVRKGTLTQEERHIIEQHVVYTDKILSEISFGRQYKNVKNIASCHHEFLNGTGYPNHLSAEDLPTEIRILTIMDVFESLTSADRPYKTITPIPKALAILDEMVKEGKLDPELVGITRSFVEEELGAKMEAAIKAKQEQKTE